MTRPDAADVPFHRLPAVQAGYGFDLLSGVRVLDLTTSVAGPYATMLLADLGAEIIKIERPGSGDDARAWGPPFLDGESLWFLSVNRNKQSITLDATSEAGRAVLHDLVRASDVVIVNHIPRTARKLGLMPWAMAFAAGAMIYVISHEIIPETHRRGSQATATVGLMLGLAVMMLLDTAL